MNLSNAALRRPITTFMVFIGAIVVGVFAFSRLAIDLLPDIEFPTVTVNVVYQGASPYEIETLVTEPIERAVSTAQNVEEVSSTSSEGRSSVRVAFTWGTDMSEAMNDIRERVARVRPILPEDIEEPGIFKFDTSAFPVMFLSLSGELPSDKIRHYADNEVKYRLEQIEGVASVDVYGGLEREIQVNVDGSRLEAVGVTFAQVRAALRSENLDMPGGYLESDRKEVLVRTSGQFRNLNQIANTVVGYRGGAPIYLHQVADVADSFKEQRFDSRIQGKPAVSIAIRKQPGENTVKVADRVNARVAAIQEILPEGMVLAVRWDTSNFIRDSIRQIQESSVIGGILAILILMFFLKSGRATTIIGVSIPIAVIATFILMDLAGLTLNMMSLGGIALGIGMLVDNAVVVLENIYNHRQRGKSPEEAAALGANEVSGAISASTWTTLCVFLPLLFIGGGVQGIFFGQLAYTVSFSLLASLAVALTLLPVLAMKFLKNVPGEHSSGSGERGIGATLNRQLNRMMDTYGNALRWSLNHRLWIVGVSVFMLACSIAVLPKLGTEFMPEVDEGDINVSVQLPVGTKLAVTDVVVRNMERTVQESVPELDSLRTSVGASGGFGGASGTHSANLQVRLVTKDKRKRSTQEVIGGLRKSLTGIPDAKIYVSSRGAFLTRILTRGGQQERLEVEIRGHDLEAGSRLAEQVKQLMSEIPGVVDPRVNREEGKPELAVLVDRDKASVLGLPLSAIAETVNTAMAGSVATRYREGGDEYDVRLRLKNADRTTPEHLKSFIVPTTTQSAVSLGNIAQIEEQQGYVDIQRRNQMRTVTVSASVADRDIGGAALDVSKRLETLDIPPEFTVQMLGERQDQAESSNAMTLVLLLAVALVYMVMAAQFESLLHPFVIMFSIPFAAIGVVLTLYLTGTNLSIPVYIGVIMLAGIVVNNAIVLVDYTNLLRSRGMGLTDAIAEAGTRRLRPILMTTLTTVLALIPMALGFGSGAEMQAPMARTVAGGLTTSTIFTLFFVPTVYSLVESARERFRARVPERSVAADAR